MRCYCFDFSCRRDSPRPLPDNDISLPVTVGQKVGKGGVNAKADVLTIQRALNAVGVAQGGPGVPLKTDGLIGPKTTAAIGAFQKKNISFVDFRIDPDGPTIKALNAVLARSPRVAAGPAKSMGVRAGPGQAAPSPAATFRVTADDMERVFRDIVPVAHSCVKSALRTLRQARVMGTIESRTQTLVRKYFAVVASDPPPPDFLLIEKTFHDIERQLALAEVIPEKIFVPFPFSFSLQELAESGTLALSFQNGVKDRGQTVTVHSLDGSTTAILPADAIVLVPTFFIASLDMQIGTLIHELGHFVGQPEGNPDAIDDPPGNSSSDASLRALPDQQRPRIAELYAMFAFEAHFGRPMFRSLLRVIF